MSFIIFIVAISTMILIHEMGHFLVAKWMGLKVEEFGLGYPPRLVSKKIGETIYSLNLIPMGGFVRIWGMESKVKKDKHRAFYHQNKIVQFLILSAGVIMNFILAIGVFSVIYGIKGVPRSMGKVEIIQVVGDSPAEKADLPEGSFIVAVEKNGEKIEIETDTQFIEAVNKWVGEEVILITEKGEEFKIVPRKEPPENQGPLGVIISDKKLVKTPLYLRLPEGAWLGLKSGLMWGWEIVRGLSIIIGDLVKGKPPEEFAGPIGIYKASTSIFEESGLLAVIHFFAIVSVNLAVVNIVPIPGTDGWHASILGFELIRGKPITEKTKQKINQAAMIFILLLSALIIASDVKRFVL